MAAINRVIVFAVMLALAGCQTTGGAGRYTGDTQYYWADVKPKDGVVELWSCREPNEVKGGNCMVDSEWPDGGLSR